MRLRMAAFLIAGSVGLAGCTAGPYGAGAVDVGAYTASPAYADGNGYGYASAVPGPVYVAPPSAYEYGGPAYYGAPAYVGGGIALLENLIIILQHIATEVAVLPRGHPRKTGTNPDR